MCRKNPFTIPYESCIKYLIFEKLGRIIAIDQNLKSFDIVIFSIHDMMNDESAEKIKQNMQNFTNRKNILIIYFCNIMFKRIQ